jgi:hypothetical protein
MLIFSNTDLRWSWTVARDEEALGHRASVEARDECRDHLALAWREPIDAAAPAEGLA